jgi:hypothetical protein
VVKTESDVWPQTEKEITVTLTNNSKVNEEMIKQALSDTFYYVWANAGSPRLKIPWARNILNEDSTFAQIRSQQNKLLNSFLEAARSRMQVVTDREDSQVEIQTAASSAKKQTVNILHTLLRQLQNILASIYR